MNRIQKKFHSFYSKENVAIGKEIWRVNGMLLKADQVQEKISEAILEKKPFSAGKIGSNEQVLIQWAFQIPIELSGFGEISPFFFQTSPCLTNAGAKPRTKKEYQKIANLFRASLLNLDLLPIFKLAGEKSIVENLQISPEFCGHLEFLPFKQVAGKSWTDSLSGKKIVVVSPFQEEILQQFPIMEFVWASHNIIVNDFEIEVIKFPYLIDRDNELHWEDIYNEVKRKLIDSDADVGLFGCGFMGMLFADVMKQQGKVGIHLGGALQFLFGIKGKRYEQQDWFAKYINEYWIRPGEGNVPKCSNKIENGCYW
ncbi:hypothetical protein [Mangrovimonas xylaniphaga]|uniref:hypothetical protein n=1 Tax=Mangrovimonas xylaniphaga TaxID=1645915 RepID=UPI0006B56A72|nr:hypothetical protein [Mangrovimonas xylaniphaga]